MYINMIKINNDILNNNDNIISISNINVINLIHTNIT